MFTFLLWDKRSKRTLVIRNRSWLSTDLVISSWAL